ncbi:YhgE/Pip domain-containing protein [Paenibacillus sp. MZ04-78.2]|uniref:YhgE/Pip domain-containing protein n=1 Tax=Paenibacillus sp. MZ04-78.2 TaxID=2962034 RepID=UPI00265FE8C1|nr:YhgE/Pip domain-containing protein [Paenibacillus sp. MZ04-78.2]
MRKVSLRTVLRIYTHDIRRIVTNWVTLTVVCGLIMLPSLYAWINIYASWDPYANTKGIKVGVVNNDTGGTLKGLTFNIGDEIVHSLKQNEKLGWTFYNTKDEGIAKAKNGEVYATIVIPDDFSLKMSTMLSDQPVKPDLEYYVNEKENAIASKMTDAGASTIQREISTTFVKTVTEKVFATLNQAGAELDQRYPQIEKYKNLLYVLNENMPKLNQNLDEMLNRAENGFTKLNKTADHVPAVQDTLGKLMELNDGLSKDMYTASGNIKEIAPDVKENLYLLQTIFNKLAETTEDVNEQLTLYKPEVLTQLDNAVTDLDQLQQRVKDSSEQLEKAGVTLPKETLELASDIAMELNLFRGLLTDLKANIKDVGAAEKILNKLQPINDRILGKITKFQTAINELLAPIDEALNIRTFARLRDNLENIRQLSSGISSFTRNLSTTLAYKKANVDGKLSKSIDSISNMINRLLKNANSLAQSSAKGSFQLSKDLKSLAQRLEEWKGKTADLRKNIEQNQNLEKLLPDLARMNFAIAGSIGKLSLELDQTLFPKTESYLQKGSNLFADVNVILGNTQEDLAAAKDLMAGMASGGKIAVDDIRNFKERVPDLQQRLSDLTAVFQKIDSTVDVKDMIKLLKNRGIADNNFLALPVTMSTHPLFPISNYGAGMTPFYTTLSLWVGCLLLMSLLTVKFQPADFSFTSHEEYLGKYLLFATLSVLQGLIVALGDIFLLKIGIQEAGLFIGLTVLYCVVFSMIIYTLVSLFNNIGKSIGVVLLVLQLAGSGGTFPIQVTPAFFQTIHSMLPFTYAISGLREALAGVSYPTLMRDVWTLVGFFVSFLVIGYMFKPALTSFLSKYSKQLHHSGVIGH